jgi:hypothetical protein
MQWKRLFPVFCFSIISFLLMLTACSKPILKMPKPLPPIVQQYKHKTIHGNIPGMQGTGVYLNEGDFYSILATGRINLGLGRDDFGPWSGWFTARIGKNYHFPAIVGGYYASTHTALDSGKLYLGIVDGRVTNYGEPRYPQWYRDNSGSFSVDIIVWEKEDYVQIADFFEKLQQEDPENKAIADASRLAFAMKKIYLAEAKASQEIEETKKEIQELREESPVTADLREDKRIAQLEAKLSELTETLKQLEEMKRQLHEEREKTTLLSKELSQKEMREKDLLTRLEQAEKNPPVIVVAAPKDGIEVEVGKITFSGVAEDDQGLKGLDIFINNNPLPAKVSRDLEVAEMKRPKRLEFAERIRLERGRNEIRIRATDSDGLSAEKILTVRYRETRKNVWAVVIGIDKYRKNRDLKYAVNDARAFYDHLIRNNRIPAENVTLLINQDAHIIQLRSILGTHLKNKAGKEDMVIIYFAGHGACEKDVMSPDGDGLEKYILPHDADPKDLYGSALPMSEVSRIFNRIRSERLIFIADACYSGATGGRTISLTGMRANISDAFLDRIATGKGRVILTASGANEVSGEDDELQHGVFTYFLLEGLRGEADTDRDGIITVDEVYRYVSRKVPRATGQEQHPVKKGIVKGQLILGVVE